MNPLKLWIDDVRNPPEDDWIIARTSAAAIAVIEYYLERGGSCSQMVISFDHDLGGDDTAMKVVMYIEGVWMLGNLPSFTWHVHSGNPVGAANIRRALGRLDAFLAANAEAQEF